MHIHLMELLMSLFFLFPALAGEQTVNTQERFLRPETRWMDLKQSQMLSQMQTRDEEGEATLVRPEQLVQLATEFSRWMEGLKVFQNPLTKGSAAGLHLTMATNYLLQRMLEQTSETMLRAARTPKAWQGYLEQTQVLNQLENLAQPELLVQKTKALRQRLDRLDFSKLYWDQIGLDDQEDLKALQREFSLIADFITRHQKRD